eukprot:176609-Pyramimonas_sp.AAC.1
MRRRRRRRRRRRWRWMWRWRWRWRRSWRWKWKRMASPTMAFWQHMLTGCSQGCFDCASGAGTWTPSQPDVNRSNHDGCRGIGIGFAGRVSRPCARKASPAFSAVTPSSRSNRRAVGAGRWGCVS